MHLNNTHGIILSGLRGIVSNAGIVVTGDSEYLPIHLFKKCMKVNFFGAVRLIQTFLPLIRQSKGTRFT